LGICERCRWTGVDADRSAGAGAHFDEVFFRSKDVDGTEYAVVRPPYREVVSAVRDLSKKDLERVDRKTTADFRGDNALSAVPRILVSSEYDGILKRGVDQRGRALRAFLEDYYRNGGHPSFVTSGRMNQVVLDAIVSRSLELQYRNKIDPKSISALYGPDIVRDAHGVFRVVEDNTGFIGGMGDLEMALKSLTKNVKGLDGLAERAPLDFYLKLVERYRSRAVPSGGRLVVVQMPPYADFEDRRFMSLMKRIGVDVVTPYTKGKLEFDSSGAWYRPDINAPRERVGFLYLNGEHCWLDMKNPLTEPVAITEYAKIVAENLESRARKRSKKGGAGKEVESRLLSVLAERDSKTGFPDVAKLASSLNELGEWEEFRKWRRRSFKGLLESVISGKVASNYTPGTNFVNDKEFYLFVPEMVRYYLGEEPILQNIKTYDPRMKDGSGRADLEFLARVEREREKFVIKVVDGRGGKGIWVGPKVSEREFRAGLEAVRAEPGRYKIQEYTPLSVKGDEIVDIRVPADLPPSGRLFVSDIGWGRSLPLNGDGKVNLSATGRETTIIVRSAGQFCKDLFQPTPADMIFKVSN
jgi:uncharacterized circularly permuted ATP-grasp superfamily protein